VTNPQRFTTIAGGTPALQASQRPSLAVDVTNPQRFTTIAGGTPALQASQSRQLAKVTRDRRLALCDH